MFQSPGKIAFQLGSFSVHWYGLFIGLGILLCYLYAIIEARRKGVSVKNIDDMAFWVIISGIIGARLYYVLFNLSYFSDYPLEILQIWKGGLAIHGALIGGALAYFIFAFWRKISWTVYADIIIPGVLLAQAIGRWGNFFNNEAFGTPTSLPWKLYIPEQFRPDAYIDFAYFHPAFLYESLWNFVGFAVLFILSRKIRGRKQHAGIVLYIYLIWYSFGRFFIEFLRTDSLYIWQFKAAQIISFILFICGVVGLLFLFKKHKIQSFDKQ